MRLTVFGASGRTGREIVSQALAAGHSVTAVVRYASRLPVTGEKLNVVEIPELGDPDVLRDTVTGADAVLSAIGPSTRKHAGAASSATRAISHAMELTGVRRLIVVSASPLGPVPEGQTFLLRWVLTPLIGQIFKENYADLRVMEAELAHSGLDWTAVRPPQLVDRPETGTYRTAIGANLRGGRRIGRADLAHAMLAMIGDTDTFARGVGVAY